MHSLTLVALREGASQLLQRLRSMGPCSSAFFTKTGNSVKDFFLNIE
jgi:hypothetical protein